MNSKKLIWFCVAIGSTIGAYIPNLWGDSVLSGWSILLTAVGGLLGVWVGYKLSN